VKTPYRIPENPIEHGVFINLYKDISSNDVNNIKNNISVKKFFDPNRNSTFVKEYNPNKFAIK
jgi:hypothetical protein